LIDFGHSLVGPGGLNRARPSSAAPVLSDNAQRVLAVLPGPGEPSLGPLELSERSGLNYNSTNTALKSLRNKGYATNPVAGKWRRDT
jgi:hypothetical protein